MGHIVSEKFASAFEESERVSAELNAFRHENAKLRDEIDMVERVEREKLAALVQAGYKVTAASASAVHLPENAPFASVPNSKFSTYESRLKSYRAWPHSAAIRPLAMPTALASQGFYFSPDDHYKDRVLCAFCNLELAEWGPKDDPIYEHGRRCPTCPVVTGVVMAVQSSDPDHVNDIIAEEEESIVKLEVLQVGMKKQLEVYTQQIRQDKIKREQLEAALQNYRATQ
mmetsp:Transcript_34729/g.82295  ORF Transcript_34729/g.82295 Transcript_34729/m.82295 type:complete len:228 (-) Transcript_34729:47-730(-)